MLKLFLAPMEGVTDWVMRDLITEVGGIDQCVTEFLRVTDKLHPESVFLKNCPELKTQSRTRSGTPVFIQLLGGQAEPLAMNAARAAKLGALGIDLNFGCPAKTVNRHDGGASLLKSCNRLYDIAKTVRAAVPAQVPVTAKIRLGFDNPESCLENVRALTEGGIQWITVHCRTKTDGYRPPAYWEWIPKIKEVTHLPIIANGEIWSVEDFKRCQEVTACDQFMIGRGMMSNPFIFKQIKSEWAQQLKFHNFKSKGLELSTPDSVTTEAPMSWERARPLLPQFFNASTSYINSHFAVARTKQWLKMLSLREPEAKVVFDELKVLTKPPEFESRLHALTGFDGLNLAERRST